MTPRGARRERSTGALFGAARFAKLVAWTLAGLGDVELGRLLGGELRAERHLRRAARRVRACFGLELELRGELPDALEIRVANHTGFLDVLLLCEIGAGSFLAMREVEGWPVVGRVAKTIGVVFVDREDRGSRREALSRLIDAAKRRSVVVFPEGAANKGTLAPFQRGAFVAARAANTPIRPIAIAFEDEDEVAWIGDTPLLRVAWQLLAGPGQRVTLTVLDAIDASRPSAELAKEAREAISVTLGKPVGGQG